MHLEDLRTNAQNNKNNKQTIIYEKYSCIKKWFFSIRKNNHERGVYILIKCK